MKNIKLLVISTILILLIMLCTSTACRKSKPTQEEVSPPEKATTPLAVIQATPRGQTSDRAEYESIIVIFNQPMVALAATPQDRGQGPLIINPPVSGKFRWLGTATLSFTPDEPLPGGTEFRLKVPAGTMSLSGAILEKDYTWKFQTIRPRLLAHLPKDKAKWITPDQAIVLQFNQPINPETAGAFLRVTEIDHQGREKPLSFQTRRPSAKEKFPGKIESTIILQVQPKLKPDRTYRVEVLTGLPGQEGPLGLAETQSFTFQTLHTFAFLGLEKIQLLPDDPLGLKFTNPVSYPELISQLKFEPALEIPDYYSDWHYHENFLWLYLPFKPETTYRLTISPELSDQFNNKLGQEVQISFHTGSYPPEIEVITGRGIIEAYGNLNYPLALLNTNSLELQAARLSINDVIPLLKNNRTFWSDRPLATGKNFFHLHQTLTFNPPPNKRTIQPLDLKKILPPGKKHGLLFLQFTHHPQGQKNPRYLKTLLQITALGITAKFSPENNLVWVTSLLTGLPLADVTVEIRDDNNKVHWRGRTDTRGLVKTPGWQKLHITSRQKWRKPRQWVFAIQGEDIAFTASDWETGIYPESFGFPYDWKPTPEKWRGYLFTERGIYRAGEEVFIKGLLREKIEGKWRFPSLKKLKVTVVDSRQEKILDKTMTLNNYGAFSLRLQLKDKAPLGYYFIKVTAPVSKDKKTETSLFRQTSFRVEAFKPVEFTVSVRPAQADYTAGDTYEAEIMSHYLFGAPLSGREVEWFLRQEATVYTPPGHKGYFFGPGYFERVPEPEESKLLTSGKDTLDQQGRVKISYKLTELPIKGPSRINLEGIVTGPGRQKVAGRTSRLIHPGEFYIGLKPASTLIKKNKKLDIAVIAVNPEGEMLPGKKITLRLLKREWYSVRKAGLGGRSRWLTEAKDKEIQVFSITTQEEPATLSVTPKKAGFYLLEARGKDKRGHQIKTTAYFYATGGDYVAWQRSNEDIIELVADKSQYQPGEKAHLLVKSPYERSQALITIEREGILDSWVEEIKGSAGTIEIPLTKDHLPNVFVSVILVQGRTSTKVSSEKEDLGRPSFKIGYINLPVSPAEKKLRVEIIPDKKEYRPGETVQITLKVQDKNHQGKAAEVCLAVVDVGVLSLINYQTPDPFTFFYGERPLGVQTSDTRPHIIGWVTYGEKGDEVGGGGGQARYKASTPAGLRGIELRKLFKATAYWNPSLIIPAEGKTTVSFKLPDNLTTFRLMAVAHTEDCFGSAQTTFKVNKPLLLRPAFPRFARVGDEFEAGVIIHNYTGQKGKVVLTAAAEGLSLLKKKTRSFVLQLEEAREIRFPFKVVKPGRAEISFRARLGKETDGLQISLPLHLPRPTETVAFFKETTQDAQEKIKIPAAAHPEASQLEFEAAATALTGLKESFNYLISYPYGCLEQRLSSILPFIVAQDLIDRLNLTEAKTGDWRKYVKKTLAEIHRFQRPNGGFSLWPDSRYDSPYLTCYTLFTLLKARQAGWAVEAKLINSAQQYLLDLLHDKLKKTRYPYPETTWNSIKAFALYVSALNHQYEAAYVDQLFQIRESLPLEAISHLLKTIHLSRRDNQLKEILLQELLNKIKVSPTTAHFEETQNKELRWIYASSVRTTALILQTLLEINEDHPLLASIVRWLVEERQIGRWRSTQENFYALAALNDYYRRYEKEEPSFKVKVALAGRLILEETFKGRNVGPRSSRLSLAQFPAGKILPLEIRKKGPGRLYYGFRMTYAPLNPSQPRDEGLAVYKTIEPLEGKPGQHFKPGSLVKITLKIVTPQARHFVVVNDPLPAGFVAVNPNLVTASEEKQRKIEEALKKQFRWGAWSRFNHIEIHDDRVLLFADYLTPGIHTHTYLAQVVTYGTFQLPAATAEEMYHPEVYGRSGEVKIKIKD